MSAVSISVVIPSYNSGHWVVQALDSVLAQTMRPGQIIVVDDGSTDDTRLRVESYRDRGVEYLYQENQGVAAARNAGIAGSRGDLIALLDADDYWSPRKLELQIPALMNRPNLLMLGTREFAWPGPVPEVPETSGDHEIREIMWPALVVRNRIATSSVVMLRKALDVVGPGVFDTNLQGPEDWDLWLRMAEKGTIANMLLPLTGYRVSGGLGNRVSTMEPGMKRILKKLDDRGAWKGRGGTRIRHKARAFSRYSFAIMHANDGNRRKALVNVLRSMLEYPLPFGSGLDRTSFARPKFLGALLLRSLGLKGRNGQKSESARVHSEAPPIESMSRQSG